MTKFSQNREKFREIFSKQILKNFIKTKHFEKKIEKFSKSKNFGEFLKNIKILKFFLKSFLKTFLCFENFSKIRKFQKMLQNAKNV